MKTIIVMLFATSAVVLIVGCVSESGTSPKQANGQLPATCSLMSMSSEERTAHLQRLENLRHAARLSRQIDNGFVFEVDLALMPETELRRWMEAEQECYSFLRLEIRPANSRTSAEVTVAYPAELRAEVMQTFGLASQ